MTRARRQPLHRRRCGSAHHDNAWRPTDQSRLATVGLERVPVEGHASSPTSRVDLDHVGHITPVPELGAIPRGAGSVAGELLDGTAVESGDESGRAPGPVSR
jgi:hypothetical protein